MQLIYGWHFSKDINPENNISIVDVSGLIPENIKDNEKSSKLVYANELGILEDELGNPYFSSNEIYVSDILLNEEVFSEKYEKTYFDDKKFAMAYYVSRFFTLLKTTAHFDINLNSYIEPKYIPNNIKVIDEKGNLYADPISGRLKYRITFESFITNQNINQNEIPHKIIILLEDFNPSNLKLVYDKVETDENGIWKNQVLGYSEYINALPVFNKIQEETEVIDPVNVNKKIYSVKRNTKENYINKSKYGSENNLIYVGKKAIDDNRNFQTFNWRIIAKAFNKVDFSVTNYGVESSKENVLSKTIKVGIIYSSNQGLDFSKINPYVFANVEKSSFNLANYDFINHNSTLTKDQGSYWLVDIDSVDEKYLSEYDVLACSLHWTLTESQSAKLRSFYNSSGTLIIDANNAPNNALVSLNPALTIKLADTVASAVAPETLSSDSIYLRSSKNNAHDITSSIFAAGCGIYGYHFDINNNIKKYNYFDNSKIDSILATGSKKYFAAIRKSINTDSLISGNIIVSTTGFLAYCNNIYSGDIKVSTPNYESTNLAQANSTIFSNYVEGPYRFLYNCVAVALNDKIESKRTKQDYRSSIHYFSGKWNNEWIINPSALDEEEIKKHFQHSSVNGNLTYVRQLMSNPKIKYINELSEVVSSLQNVFFDQNDSNISLYLEYTNSNILFTNTSSVTEQEKKEIGSSYNLLKIVNKQLPCEAYTEVYSPKFIIPSGFGPYVIRDKPIPAKINKLSIVPRVAPKKYLAEFKVNHSITSGTDIPKRFDANVTVDVNVNFIQEHTFEIKRTVKEVVKEAVPETPGTDGTLQRRNVSNFESSQSGKFNRIKDLTEISDPFHAFNYTYDIDAGNTWDEYFKNKGSSLYIRYIQLTLTVAGYATTIDGDFGPKTEEKLKAFQKLHGIRQDGIVDSETKAHLARVWVNLSDSEYSKYVDNINKNKYGNKNIDKYTNAARKMRNCIEGLTSGEGIRLINFSGISNANRDPDTIKVWVGFQLPNESGDEYVDSITILGGGFGTKVSSDSYQGFKVLDLNIGDDYDFNVGKSNYKTSYDINGVTIKFSSPAGNKGKYVSVLLQGSSLGGAFGSTAEGIYVSDIYATAMTQGIPGIPGTEKVEKQSVKISYFTDQKDISGTVSVTIPFKNISFSTQTAIIDAEVIKKGTLKSISVYQLDAEKFSDNIINYTNLSQSMGESNYKPDANRQEEVNLNSIKQGSIDITSFSVVQSSIKESGTDISYATAGYISLTETSTASVQSVTVSSNYSSYSSSTSYNNSSLITNYYVTDPLKQTIEKGKNSFSYYDGVKLICDEKGKPKGINLASIFTQVSSNMDVYYSDIELINTMTDVDGLLYGFYDITTKSFMGRTISYIKYMQTGPENVYIGVYAFDYDGNPGDIEYTGASEGNVFIPATIPTKTAYPVYCVAFDGSNKIQLNKIPEKLDKKEPWPIFISAGSFTKNIDISVEKSPEWFSAYNNQSFIAKYDTTSITSVAWSKMLGHGYFDIVDETPIILNTRSIQLRNSDLARVHEKSNDLVRFAGNFRPIIKVYTRTSVGSSWQEVDYSNFKDINCANGIIDFINPIVSTNPLLTKVSYTIKRNNFAVIQCAGTPIPTNPFLNRDSVKINKPLYIYILPKEIYKNQNLIIDQEYDYVTGLTSVEEYSVDSTINFTYNNNLFNKLDPVNYNPFALLIGVIYVMNTFSDDNFDFTDLRVKGGGISSNFNTNKVLENIDPSISYWDVYPSLGEAYPKGGYVIIKIPKNVKKNFTNPNEVYDIIKQNLTAGVVFELQDMDGNDWGSSVAISS